MKKLNRINKIGGRGVDFAVLLAVVAGWLLPVSAVDYVAHWDFGSDAQGVVDTRKQQRRGGRRRCRGI